MKHASTMPILAAALVLASLPARANSEANAYLGPISYTLRDLDPTDGWSPSLTFNAVSGSQGSAFASASQASSTDIDAHTGASSWASVDAHAATAVSQSQASISAGLDGSLIGAALSTQGSAVSGPPLASMNAYQAGVNTGTWEVVLSPHTEVTFHAMGGAVATVSPVPPSPPVEGFSLMDHAYAHSQLWAVYSLEGQVVTAAEIFAAEVTDARDDNSVLSASDERWFSLPLANLTAGSLSIQLSAAAEVLGGAVSPVPEPVSLALWASGLGLLAGVSRRRGEPDAKMPLG